MEEQRSGGVGECREGEMEEKVREGTVGASPVGGATREDDVGG